MRSLWYSGCDVWCVVHEGGGLGVLRVNYGGEIYIFSPLHSFCISAINGIGIVVVAVDILAACTGPDDMPHQTLAAATAVHHHPFNIARFQLGLN